MNNRRGAARASRPLGWLCVVFAAAAAVVIAGCSGDGEERKPPAGPLPAALSYLSDRAGAAVAIETDLDGPALESLDRLGSRLRGWPALERELQAALGRRGLDLDAVVRPQLGNPLVVGLERNGRRVAALRVRDPAALRTAVQARIRAGEAQSLGEHGEATLWRESRSRRDTLAFAALSRAELVAAQTEEDLKRAIDASSGSDNLASDAALRTALERPPGPALVRVAGDARRLLENADPGEAAELRRIRWIAALGSFSGAATVGRRGIEVAFRLATDRATLAPKDLPLARGEASPRLHAARASASLAVREPVQLARFLERTLAVTDPARAARLRSGIEAVRALFGVDVHEDLLEPVTGLSIAAVSATGTTFQATLRRGAAGRFARDLDRARPLIEGVAAELAPGSTVEVRGSGAGRVWSLRAGGLTVARYGVRGNKLVGSIGLAGLPAPARGRRLGGTRGALALAGEPSRLASLADLLPGIPDEAVDVLGALGDFRLGVRAETDGLTGRGRVVVRR